MKDIDFAPGAETANVSGLHTEWMDGQAGSGKMVLVAANQDAGPGKDVADRLDAELKQFATSPLNHPSADLLDFQKLIGKFEDAPDKKQGMQDIGDAISGLKVKMANEAETTFSQMEAAAAKVPGRAALDADLQAKENKFFDGASSLPGNGEERVLDLMQFKPGETRDQRDQRVRDGLNNPALLQSFNQMEAATDKVEQSKTPQEKQLEQLHSQELDEAKTVRAITNEAYIRSQIPN